MDARLVGSAQLFETSSYYLRQSVKGLDDEQLRQRVGKANSILWTLGHITVERLRLLNILGETDGRHSGLAEVGGAGLTNAGTPRCAWGSIL